MKTLTIAVLFLCLKSHGYVEPCSTFLCDSLVFKAILDTNKTQMAFAVKATVEEGRIVEFNFDNRNLTKLPPEIGKLSKLKGLLLGNNKFTSLPPEIGQLTALKRLIISGNQLTSLPPEI